MCLGIPGELLETYDKDEMPMGKVKFGGIAKDICLAYTPEAQVGQYVIVHVGFALNDLTESARIPRRNLSSSSSPSGS